MHHAVMEGASSEVHGDRVLRRESGGQEQHGVLGLLATQPEWGKDS